MALKSHTGTDFTASKSWLGGHSQVKAEVWIMACALAAQSCQTPWYNKYPDNPPTPHYHMNPSPSDPPGATWLLGFLWAEGRQHHFFPYQRNEQTASWKRAASWLPLLEILSIWGFEFLTLLNTFSCVCDYKCMYWALILALQQRIRWWGGDWRSKYSFCRVIISLLFIKPSAFSWITPWVA